MVNPILQALLVNNNERESIKLQEFLGKQMCSKCIQYIANVFSLNEHANLSFDKIIFPIRCVRNTIIKFTNIYFEIS